jgi:hypothetical protein
MNSDFHINFNDNINIPINDNYQYYYRDGIRVDREEERKELAKKKEEEQRNEMNQYIGQIVTDQGRDTLRRAQQYIETHNDEIKTNTKKRRTILKMYDPQTHKRIK